MDTDQKIKLTREHLSILLHTRDRAAHRFYCGGSPEMNDLVLLGLMVYAGRKSFVPDDYFTITGDGLSLIQDIGRDEKFSKGQLDIINKKVAVLG